MSDLIGPPAPTDNHPLFSIKELQRVLKLFGENSKSIDVRRVHESILAKRISHPVSKPYHYGYKTESAETLMAVLS